MAVVLTPGCELEFTPWDSHLLHATDTMSQPTPDGVVFLRDGTLGWYFHSQRSVQFFTATIVIRTTPPHHMIQTTLSHAR